MKKISLEAVLESVEETEYQRLFRPLLGYEDELEFYAGVDDSLEHQLVELEKIVGFEMPGDLLQVLLMTNGFKIFDFTMYSLTEKNSDKMGLHYMNTKTTYKKDYNIPYDHLILGELDEKYLVCVYLDEDDYINYVLWDREDKKISLKYDYFVEIIMSEIDFHTEAFTE